MGPWTDHHEERAGEGAALGERLKHHGPISLLDAKGEGGAGDVKGYLRLACNWKPWEGPGGAAVNPPLGHVVEKDVGPASQERTDAQGYERFGYGPYGGWCTRQSRQRTSFVSVDVELSQH